MGNAQRLIVRPEMRSHFALFLPRRLALRTIECCMSITERAVSKRRTPPPRFPPPFFAPDAPPYPLPSPRRAELLVAKPINVPRYRRTAACV